MPESGITLPELPPEIQADRFLVRAERMEAEKDYVGALKALDDFLALQTAHKLTLPEDYHFRVARVAFSAGMITRAYDAATRYLTGAGKKGQFYRDAIVLLEKSELMMPIEPQMVAIPAGRFRMGCGTVQRFKNCKPVHDVTMGAFHISKFEVTFEEYDRFAKATGRTLPYDRGWGRDRRPVIDVSWYDAVAYTQWLSTNTGKRYRLPSEAEWEYAARGGITGDGNKPDLNAIAWWGGNANGRTHPVGGKAPNAYGLYDMFGNAWEWTQDCENVDYRGVPADGSAWESGDCTERNIRGGGYINGEGRLFVFHVWFRDFIEPDSSENVGFRVARTSELKE